MSALENLETAVSALLARQKEHTPESIRKQIEDFRVVFSVSDADAEYLARRFEERYSVSMTVGSVLKGKSYEPWLDGVRVAIDPFYWERYRQLLASKGLSGQVIATTDEVTERILGLLENPEKQGPWDRRGMVVGHVQSGKTSNYTGVICKAADAGYGLIVVIAGVHNNLRNQTQLRIDEGFVGRDSARLLARAEDSFVGVGTFDNRRRPVTFTNSRRDFNKTMATGVGIPLQTLKEPAVFVIKKNSKTLENLIEWLSEHSIATGGKVDLPMLVIDDEADNASINVSQGRGEVSKINAQIRSLLKLFQRSCYVGYTATPFANIFIDPETESEMLDHDLFPRDFIISLDPPSNYFGAPQVFLDPESAVVRHVEDYADWLPLSHKIDTRVETLSPSLLFALRSFVLARAIRLARGHTAPHCSMLVNVSRFTGVQRQVRDAIHEALVRIQTAVRVQGALPSPAALRDPEIAAIYEVWSSEYADSLPDWEQVKHKLHESAAPIRVVEVNSSSSGTLNYAENAKDGLNVVAVGGYSLSRGLTLEGLMISYFLRNSVMYDTLMQMGRWFGYRPDYEDLCRVWMPEEAEGWYAHIAESIEELREELRRMEAAGATPAEFGLKVRNHPDNLVVTARNKMGSAKSVTVRVSLSERFIETALLAEDPQSLAANLALAADFGRHLAATGHPPDTAELQSGGWVLRGVPAGPISEFVRRFRNHGGWMLTDPEPVTQYIGKRVSEELAEWDVLLAGVQKTDATIRDTSLGVEIYCQRRKVLRPPKGGIQFAKHRIATRGVERTGLSVEKIARAEEAYRTKKGLAEDTVNYPDYIYREVRTRPLFVLHLLNVTEGGPPVVGYSISFPKSSDHEETVEYVVNTTWLRENYGAELEGSDEFIGDDDV